MKKIITAVLVCLSAVQLAKGVYIDFNGTPGAQPVSMTFAQDVNFTITKDDNMSYMMFIINDLFATPDANLSEITSFSALLEFSINGGSHFQVNTWIDNFTLPTVGDIDANDGYFYGTGSFNLTAGDVVTLHAGTLTSLKPPAADFNLGVDGNYTVFIAGSDAYSITGAVPEPATALSLALGGAVLGLIRRFYGQA